MTGEPGGDPPHASRQQLLPLDLEQISFKFFPEERRSRKSKKNNSQVSSTHSWGTVNQGSLTMAKWKDGLHPGLWPESQPSQAAAGSSLDDTFLPTQTGATWRPGGATTPQRNRTLWGDLFYSISLFTTPSGFAFWCRVGKEQKVSPGIPRKGEIKITRQLELLCWDILQVRG